MLLTVTPNLCIERTLLIDGFASGSVHRVPPDKMRVNAGGKGINVSRVAAALGTSTVAVAWVGRRQHDWFRHQLTAEGVPHELVEVEADTRTCINILSGQDLQATVKTEIVEAGNPLSSSDGENLSRKVASLLPNGELLAICGSYPSTSGGATSLEQHLTELVSMANGAGVKVLVDSKGPTLKKLMESAERPWCIKPNVDEAAQLLGRPIEGKVAERRAVDELLELGPQVVLLSCGERGAYLGARDGVVFLQPPAIRQISPVGSGDAMVGAFASVYLTTGDLEAAAKWGVAAGAANAAQSYSAFCTRADIEPLVSQVQARPAA